MCHGVASKGGAPFNSQVPWQVSGSASMTPRTFCTVTDDDETQAAPHKTKPQPATRSPRSGAGVRRAQHYRSCPPKQRGRALALLGVLAVVVSFGVEPTAHGGNSNGSSSPRAGTADSSAHTKLIKESRKSINQSITLINQSIDQSIKSIKSIGHTSLPMMFHFIVLFFLADLSFPLLLVTMTPTRRRAAAALWPPRPPAAPGGPGPGSVASRARRGRRRRPVFLILFGPIVYLWCQG